MSQQKIRVLMCGVGKAFELKGNIDSCSEEDISVLANEIINWINEPVNAANRDTASRRANGGVLYRKRGRVASRFTVSSDKSQMCTELERILKPEHARGFSLKCIAG